jgi:hypothetical protein
VGYSFPARGKFYEGVFQKRWYLFKFEFKIRIIIFLIL